MLEGHAGDVSCVAIAPSGAYVVSGSFDRTLRIWSPFSGVAPCHPPPLPSAKNPMAAGCVAQSILSAGQRATQRCQQRRGSPCAPRHLVAWRFRAFGPPLTAPVPHVSAGEVLGVAKGHTGDVTSVAVCPDSLSFVSGQGASTSCMLMLWCRMGGGLGRRSKAGPEWRTVQN